MISCELKMGEYLKCNSPKFRFFLNIRIIPLFQGKWVTN